jgi:hypothetical protein
LVPSSSINNITTGAAPQGANSTVSCINVQWADLLQLLSEVAAIINCNFLPTGQAQQCTPLIIQQDNFIFPVLTSRVLNQASLLPPCTWLIMLKNTQSFQSADHERTKDL